LASVNPKTEAQELVVAGTSHDVSFHLIPGIPANLYKGIPFISLIDEFTMKVIWSKAFDLSKVVVATTSVVHHKITSLAVSSN
jgi:hypothetical protein